MVCNSWPCYELEIFFACWLLLPATLRMAGSLQKSTDVMKAMQQLIRLPEIRDAMLDLSREMSKVELCAWAHVHLCSTVLLVVVAVS